MNTSQSFTVGHRVYEQPNLRYWEDIDCPFCEKLTEHRRNTEWDLICIECGKHVIPDPLKYFLNKTFIDNNKKKYLFPKLEKRIKLLEANCKQWFLNVIGLNKEKYLESFGNTIMITFTDFDGQTITEELRKHRLKIAKDNHIAIFYTHSCDMGQYQAKIWWDNYLRVTEWIDSYKEDENNDQRMPKLY